MQRGKKTLFMLSLLVTFAVCQQFSNLGFISKIIAKSTSKKAAASSSSKAAAAAAASSSSAFQSNATSSSSSSQSSSSSSSSSSQSSSSSSSSSSTTTTTYNSADYYPIYNCSGNILRVEQGKTIDWESIVSGSTAYTDSSFPISTALQWGWPYSDDSFNGTGYTSSISFYRARNNLTLTPTLFNGVVTGADRRDEVDQR